MLAFLGSLLGMIIKVVIICAFAACGALVGKKLRDNKDKKN